MPVTVKRYPCQFDGCSESAFWLRIPAVPYAVTMSSMFQRQDVNGWVFKWCEKHINTEPEQELEELPFG